MHDDLLDQSVRALAGDPPGPDAAARGHARRRLEAEIAPRQRARPWPRRALSFGVVSSLLVVTLAATGVFDGGPDLAQGVTCFERPRLEGNELHLPTTTTSPAAACAGQWRRGAMTEGRPVLPPPLTACQSRRGRVAVLPLPLGTACRDLDLATLPSAYESSARRYATLYRTLVVRLSKDDCVGLGAAQDLVRDELDRVGLRSWIVETGSNFSPTRPCAAPAVDSQARKVRLLAVESALREPQIRRYKP